MKRHPNDQQPKHDDYVEVGETEAPTADRGGEFFLARYRKLCPDAAIVEARVPQDDGRGARALVVPPRRVPQAYPIPR
jgi:hypothetical protein